MGLDIKLPIGLMFVLFGLLLTIFGLITADSNIYNISLDININLWSGIFMLIFGGVMLLFAGKIKKSQLTEEAKDKLNIE
jgi:amino acid transporter